MPLPTDELRTYEITFSDRGPMRITIPATWKVTYGAVVPGSKIGGTYGLRIWETGEKQRAVWANVESFRDLSIQTEIAAVRKYGTEGWYANLVEKAWKPESEVTLGTAAWMNEPMGDEPEEAAPKRYGAKPW